MPGNFCLTAVQSRVQVKLRCNYGTGTSHRLKCLSLKFLQPFRRVHSCLNNGLGLALPAHTAPEVHHHRDCFAREPARRYLLKRENNRDGFNKAQKKRSLISSKFSCYSAQPLNSLLTLSEYQGVLCRADSVFLLKGERLPWGSRVIPVMEEGDAAFSTSSCNRNRSS